MTEHLTSDQVTDWRSGVTGAEDLLRLDDHLAECAKCRALVAGDLKSGVQALQAEFSQVHLTETELDDYAARRPISVDSMQHLDLCSECRADADDLGQFASGHFALDQPAETPVSPRPNALRWLYPIAAMLALTAIGVTAWLADRKHTATPSRVPVEVASNIPPQFETEVKAALSSGTLHIPAGILGLAGGSIQFRSADKPATASSFHILSPIATGVLEATPLFRWTPVDGASYSISVYDDQFRLVASAASLKVAEWSPEKPLTRDATYRWEVRSIKGPHTDHSPGPTDPEARFTVLSAEAAKKLTEAVAAMPNEPVALGILFANAGALDDARRAFSTAATTPDPKQKSAAERLLAQLK